MTTMPDSAARLATEPQPKPRLRGWIHAVTAPLAIAAGVVLIVLAPTTSGKVACGVFAISAMLLFSTSAVYHLGHWSPRVTAALRRADHSNIFLIIAGTYTPLAVLLLPTRSATILLIVVWSGALIGLLARILWLGAPRWVYVPIYLGLGWGAVAFLPAFARTGGAAVVWLIAAGGLAYTVGAIIYATKRPDPRPRWFGFHEVFHALTVLAFTSHFIAIMIAALAA